MFVKKGNTCILYIEKIPLYNLSILLSNQPVLRYARKKFGSMLQTILIFKHGFQESVEDLSNGQWGTIFRRDYSKNAPSNGQVRNLGSLFPTLLRNRVLNTRTDKLDFFCSLDIFFA